MKKILLMLMVGFSVSAQASPCLRQELLKNGKIHTLSSSWTTSGFLWKPTAEHYNGLAVVTLPRGDVTSVRVYKRGGHFRIKTLPFRSVGVAGDAWADYARSGRVYQKQFGAVEVQVRSAKQGLRRFLLTCPSKRSDGK